MTRPAKKPAPARGKIDPVLVPFLNDIAAMIAAKLLANHRERQRAPKGSAP